MEGRASPVSAPADRAYHSSLNLCTMLKRSSPRRGTVGDIIRELEALNTVLSRLTDASDMNLSELGLPLERCIKACEGFEREVMRWSDDGGRVQEWRRLRYMGYSIYSFKQLLAAYKFTVKITIANANLEISAVTAEKLAEYKELVDSANAMLEDHVDMIEERLEVEDAATTPDQTALNDIEQERFAAENCRRICARFWSRIRKIKPLGHSAPFNLNDFPESDTSAYWRKSETGVTEIDNYATGDAVQLMFSNGNQPFRGRNRGFGNISRQAGGHCNDRSIQQISKDFESVSRHYLAARAAGVNAAAFAENNASAETASATNRRRPRYQLTNGSHIFTPESEQCKLQEA